jgi:hypothetical protein
LGVTAYGKGSDGERDWIACLSGLVYDGLGAGSVVGAVAGGLVPVALKLILGTVLIISAVRIFRK